MESLNRIRNDKSASRLEPGALRLKTRKTGAVMRSSSFLHRDLYQDLSGGSLFEGGAPGTIHKVIGRPRYTELPEPLTVIT